MDWYVDLARATWEAGGLAGAFVFGVGNFLALGLLLGTLVLTARGAAALASAFRDGQAEADGERTSAAPRREQP